MDGNWNLDAMYESCDDPQFLADLNKFDTIISDFTKMVDHIVVSSSNVTQNLETYLQKYIDINLFARKLGAYLHLVLSTDANNEKAQKFRVQMSSKHSMLTEPMTKMELFIGGLQNLDDIIAESTLLQQHKFWFEEIVKEQQYILSPDMESIISKLKNTGSSAWISYKSKLIANHKVEFRLNDEYKIMPLTAVLNLAESPDPETRKVVYKAELKSYKKIEEGIAAALNAVKGEVLTLTEKRGYDTVLEMTLQNSRMQKETLEAMLSAMKDSLPMFRKYLRRKGEMLGHENGLPWYDLFAPITEEEMKFDYKEGSDFIIKHFKTFSDKLADFAQHAIDSEWIDVYPKEGKVGGAFCAGIKDIKECRILLNYGGTIGDVSTMAHELGHGFHNLCLNDETVINSHYPMPLAETASILCETIVKQAAVKEATDSEKLAILEAEISDATQIIVDIYSRFLFESAFFEARENGYVTVEEIKSLMVDAQKQSYGDGLDENVLHPYMWTWKSHYYGPNFYNFPYAFGLLFAKGLYAKYIEDTENFPAKYEQMLKVTGKMNIEQVTETIGIDVTKKEFWEASLKIITDDIEKFLKLT
ncbi:MAG: oligoendopeptidase F [Epulopiscium sp. Nele67-Bin004]|nr:MAG: oligoendopeptidase F [Epulopiscium sp. Nele67-Bin004]